MGMKIFNFVVMFVAMMIFLEFIGLPTGLGATLNNLGIQINPTTHEVINADIQASTFWDFVFNATTGMLLAASGLVIVVGLTTRSFDINLLLLPFVIYVLVWFGSTGYTLYQYVLLNGGATWFVDLIVLIFGTLSVAYVVAMIEFVRGTD